VKSEGKRTSSSSAGPGGRQETNAEITTVVSILEIEEQ
jgi:hypothetical protein